MNPDRERHLLRATPLLWLMLPCFVPSGRGAEETPTPRPGAAVVDLQVFPPSILVDHGADQPRVLVSARTADGRTIDVTREVHWTLQSGEGEGAPEGLHVEGDTLVADQIGARTLHAEYEGVGADVPVLVQGLGAPPPTSFRRDVVPVLTKAGCNQGACHGSARGQDGFRLSLFGFDPAADLHRITKELPGRRVELAAPERSLFLRKALGEVPHTGGQRVETNDALYATLLRWLEDGAPDDAADVQLPVGIDLYPRELVLGAGGETHDVLVRARYADGSDRDVTALTVFYSSNDHSAAVDGAGHVRSHEPGEAQVLARFATFTEGTSVIVVPERPAPDLASFEVRGPIDERVAEKLVKLRRTPVEVCDDPTFLRRVTLDVCGVLPTPDEVRAFLADSSGDKRARRIDEQLARKEFVELWVMNLAELLQIRTDEANGLSAKAAHQYFHWLETQIQEDVPFDRIVRELLTRSGGAFELPATNFWQVERDTLKLAENVAQAFLGMRVQCAQCHNHPFDRWTMNDYYGFAAFFSQVGRKRGEDPRETVVFDQGSGEVVHPVGGGVVAPRFLGAREPAELGRDRREVLADWLTSPDNPWFARSLANRVWAHFFGRGIVEPVDDVRVSNPPSNAALLDHLAAQLVASGFDLRALVREICNSRTYQLRSDGAEAEVEEVRAGARAAVRRLRAEVLLDAISVVTASPSKFPGLPLGARAVQIADGSTSDYFLKTFGRASRESVCACEVVREPSLSQALHLLNGDTTVERIRQGGRVRRFLGEGGSPESLVELLYLLSYARPPRPEESAVLLADLPEDPEARILYFEDVFWALLNSKEFLFQH